jgi:4-amino-4-deoxy-L-arabinose transferase-like glycosyltransferase
VRRAFGPSAGLLAAGALALTPVTVAIGRVNNPDALLVLLLVGSGYLLVRALESGRTKHLVWCGVLVGLAFMTKMLQGWMVVPALALTYLVVGRPVLAVRIRQLLAAAVAMVAVSAAWPLAVTLWPGSTPYIGGSTDGSVWDLILGYNGFGRLTGGEGGGGGASFGGVPGLWRMFNEQVGGQIAWLLPLAAVGLVVGLWLTRRAPRTDLRRGALVLFGVWALVHVVVFSAQEGIFHPYYVSALAPAVAALAGIGVVLLWGWARRSWAALLLLDATVAGSAWLAVSLLARTPDFAPWLRVAIPVAAAVAIVASPACTRRRGRVGALRLGRRGMAVVGVAGAIALAAGPAAYSAANVTRALNGNNVLAGPASSASFGGGRPAGFAAGGSGPGSAPSGAAGSARSGAGSAPSGAAASAASGAPPSGAAGRGGPMGGSVSSSVISYLLRHQGSAKYLVAATGSQTTASIIIATGKPVVTIGGFSGGDPTPTVAQLAAMVKKGELKYVLLGGGGGPGGGSSALTEWVQQHGKLVTGSLYRVTADSQ